MCSEMSPQPGASNSSPRQFTSVASGMCPKPCSSFGSLPKPCSGIGLDSGLDFPCHPEPNLPCLGSPAPPLNGRRGGSIHCKLKTPNVRILDLFLFPSQLLASLWIFYLPVHACTFQCLILHCALFLQCVLAQRRSDSEVGKHSVRLFAVRSPCNERQGVARQAGQTSGVVGLLFPLGSNSLSLFFGLKHLGSSHYSVWQTFFLVLLTCHGLSLALLLPFPLAQSSRTLLSPNMCLRMSAALFGSLTETHASAWSGSLHFRTFMSPVLMLTNLRW